MDDAAQLEVMRQGLTAIPEEMGVVLVRSAYSPNVKERRDASCAVFDAAGRMVAQAEHIPVHLGSMPMAVERLLSGGHRVSTGDAWVVNDPYSGGSHLPDITVISPVHAPDGHHLGFAVNKAHHADVGGTAPGSMPAAARSLEEEGVVVPLTRLVDGGERVEATWSAITGASRTPAERAGDLSAQLAANTVGARRLLEFVDRHGEDGWEGFTGALVEYSRARMEAAIGRLRSGDYEASGLIEGPLSPEGGPAGLDVPRVADLLIEARVAVGDGRVTFDLSGSSGEVAAPLNAPYSVTLSAVYYALRAVTDPTIPPNHGCYLPLEVVCPEGSLLNPTPGMPVGAGNVETSQRVADVCLAALGQATPEGPLAMSQGTMNNLLLGAEGPAAFTFYETLGGGEGGSPWRPGMSGVHTHMTNTANTPVEALEASYPLAVRALRLRRGSGGRGRHPGGEGLERELELMADGATLTLMTGRRMRGPEGAAGGGPGSPGENILLREGEALPLPSMCTVPLRRGDVVVVRTPGGGGWGATEQ